MAAPVVPVGVSMATIAWLWTAAIGDETTVPTGLTVTFDPAPEWLQYTAATPHMTIAPWSVTATIGPDGTLLGPDGTANVTLLPTDDTDLNPSAWTYQVTVRQGSRVLMDFPIDAPGGVTTDLATVTPVAGSTGNAVVVGPPGPPNTLTPGTATTGAPGTDMSFSITGTAPNQVLNMTVPRGDAGGVASVQGQVPDAGGAVDLSPVALLIDGATQSVTAPGAAAARASIGAAGVSVDNTFVGANSFHGPTDFGASIGTARMPWGSTQTVDAAAPGASNKILHFLGGSFTGDFTSSTGADPQFGWGLNVFASTGSSANDGNGGNFTNLVEFTVKAASGTVNNVAALEAAASFSGAVAGARVNIMQSFRAIAPVRKSGATGGSVGSAYTAYIENCSAAAVGADSAFSLYVDGGVSRFMGRIDAYGTVANNSAGSMNVHAGFSPSDGASLQLRKNAVGGDAVLYTPGTFVVADSTGASKMALGASGLTFSDAALAQTTVGATGAAAATPAAPEKYFKIKDSTGNIYVIPGYKAA